MASTASTIAAENRAAGDAFTEGSRFKVTEVAPPPAASSRFALPWTLGMIAVGLVTLSACVLVPLREENRQLSHELANLRAEADFVRAQAEANATFVHKVHTDP